MKKFLFFIATIFAATFFISPLASAADWSTPKSLATQDRAKNTFTIFLSEFSYPIIYFAIGK